MKNTWQLVSPETAKAHPLYGIKGWLLLFAAGNLLGLLAFIGSVRREAFIANMSELEFLAIDHPAITFLKVALALNTVGTAIIYWLLFTKHQKFRAVATWLLLGVFPAIVLLGFLNPFDGLGNMIATTLFPWAISCAVWVTYLQKSERVRVTFEHCLKQDEIQRSQPSAQTSIKQAPQSTV
jgi:hypothetical protein